LKPKFIHELNKYLPQKENSPKQLQRPREIAQIKAT